MSNLSPLKGLVLAGGRSQRMGSDKAALEVGGQRLLERAVSLLRASLDDVRVSVAADQADDLLRSGYPLVIDSVSDGGPSAGLVAAHLAEPDAAWLVVACDMPLLDDLCISGLIRARDPLAGATAWRGADGEPEPLCALYEPSNLAAFAAQISSGANPGPRAWLRASGAYLLQPPEAGLFASANTPADLERIESLLAGQEKHD